MFQGQQLYQVVLESMHYCTSYGPDKFGRTHRRTDARTHAHTPNQNCNNYVSVTRKRAQQKQLNHDKPDLSQLYTKRVNHFIRRYSEFRGLCFRLSFFGTKILQNGKYLIQCYFQMHFYPPVSHEFQENTKLRTLLDDFCIFIVWPNLQHNILPESLTTEDRLLYQLNIWQLEKYM